MPVIGFLHPGSPETTTVMVDFRKGLAESGYVEGRNVAIEHRWAGSQYDRLPGLAAELAQPAVRQRNPADGRPWDTAMLAGAGAAGAAAACGSNGLLPN
jgi:putative ABC transport system substrate-binding protein